MSRKGPPRLRRTPSDPYGIVDYRPEQRDGRTVQVPVRVIDRIVETISRYGYYDDAAARAGLPADTLRWWREKGAAAQADLLAGRVRHNDLDRHTRRCVELVARIQEAEAEARITLLTHMATLAVGGHEQQRITERHDPDGQLIDRTVETRVLPPDARAASWLLTRRYPDDFAGRVQITGPRGGPVEIDVRDRLIEAVAAVRQRRGETRPPLDVIARPLPQTDPDSEPASTHDPPEATALEAGHDNDTPTPSSDDTVEVLLDHDAPAPVTAGPGPDRHTPTPSPGPDPGPAPPPESPGRRPEVDAEFPPDLELDHAAYTEVEDLDVGTEGDDSTGLGGHPPWSGP